MIRNIKVSVVILNFNGYDDTKICLTSLVKTKSSNLRIIVVDNGSKINEAKKLSEEFSNYNIKFVRFNNNWGFAEGYNRAVKNINTEYVVLLNNDTAVKPDWFSGMVKTAETDPKIAICQPKILSMMNPEFFDYAGAAGGFIDKLGYPYARGRIGFHLEKDVGQYDDQIDIFWASGTCLFIRTKLLKKYLLPREFFFYHEESDLCWRLKNDGYRVVYVPDSVIYHKGAASSLSNLPKRVFYVHRNNLLMLARNLSFNKLILVLPIRLFLDLVTAIFYAFSKQPMLVISTIKSEFSFISQLPKVLQFRYKNKTEKGKAEKDMRPLSIMWNYLVLGRRTYTQIFKNKNKQNKTIHYEKLIPKDVFKYSTLRKNKDLQYGLIIFVVSALLIFIWFMGGGVLATAEEGFSLFNPYRTVQLYSKTWLETATGFSLPILLPRVTFFIIAAFLDMFLPANVTQAIMFFMIAVSGTIGVYFLSGEFFKNNKISFFTSLFYLLNLYSMTQIWARFLYSGMTAWAYLPIFLFLWIRWNNTRNPNWLFFLILSSIIFSNSFGHPAYIFTFWIPAFVYIILEITNLKGSGEKIRKIISSSLGAFIFWIVFNIWWLYPNLIISSDALSKISDWKLNFESLRGVSINSPLSEIMLLRQKTYFSASSNPNLPWGQFFEGISVYGISIIIFIVVLTGWMKSSKNRYWLFLTSLSLLGLFVSKGVNAPLGSIFYRTLFEKVPFTAMFRNPYEKFGIVFLLSYSIFFGYGLFYITQRFFRDTFQRSVVQTIFLIIFCGLLVWPMWTGKVFGGNLYSVKISIPPSYFQANQYLKKRKSDSRLLVMPLIPDEGVKYIWGYQGIESSEYLFDIPTISKKWKINYYDDVYLNLKDAVAHNSDFTAQLDDLNIQFIMLHDDLDYKASGATDSAVIKRYLDNNPNVSKVADFGELIIYEINKKPSKIITEGQSVPEIHYKKLNSIHYVIDVYDARENFNLILKETYHSRWKAVIDGKIENNHFRTKDYANSWTVDKRGDFSVDLVFSVWPWE